MTTTSLDFLFRVEAPYIYFGEGEPSRHEFNLSSFYSRVGMEVCVRRLRGRRMQTVAGLMAEFDAVFQFFEGFGENWGALEEVLCYLDEWLPADAYVLVVEDAALVLREDRDEISAFLRLIDRVGLSWSQEIADSDRFNRPSIPFHLLLHGPAMDSQESSGVLEAAKEAGVEVRVQPLGS